MTLTKIDQAELDRIAKDLGPDVVYIRSNVGTDWAGDPAIHFRVVLSDAVANSDFQRLPEVTDRVSSLLENEFQLSDLDLFSYIDYRTLSEQEAINEPAWQ
jgi:hypothetical protein